MATVITRNKPLPIELPEPSHKDTDDIMGVRLGTPFQIPFLARFGVSTQLGTIWLGTWGFFSVVFFLAGGFVLFLAGMQQTQGNLLMLIKYFANIQILPPDGLGMATSLQRGGYWQINMLLWAAAVVCWAGRCWERLMRYNWRPYLFFAWASAILLTATIWVFRPLARGSWAEAPALGLNSDLDWAQNFSVLWGNLYYNPWHMLAIFFLFGSTMLWGMHGATILATASEGSHMEDAEIRDMHSGSHKSMLFWRWTMGFNANPKTIHDWLLWFSVGTVLASALGIISTGVVTRDWYVWGVQTGWVQQYGPMTLSAINHDPIAYDANLAQQNDASLQTSFDNYRPIALAVHFPTAGSAIQSDSETIVKSVAALLTDEPSAHAEIQGNTDGVGDPASNLRLSKARADAVKADLVKNYHIDASRLTTVGYGDTHPVASNDTDEGRAENRRVDLVRVGGS